MTGLEKFWLLPNKYFGAKLDYLLGLNLKDFGIISACNFNVIFGPRMRSVNHQTFQCRVDSICLKGTS